MFGVKLPAHHRTQSLRAIPKANTNMPTKANTPPNGPRNVVKATEELCHSVSPCDIEAEQTGKRWEVIPRRLFWTMHRDEAQTIDCIKASPSTFYFSSWMQDAYQPFCSDFGPVNLAAVVRFCDCLDEKLNDPRLASRDLVYYCDADREVATNTAFLLGAYLVLVAKWTPEAAAQNFDKIEPSPFSMFRDATHVASTFDLCLVDCFRGLQRAVDAGWLDYERFDVAQYELLDDPDTADAHVICPKFVAFRGPCGSVEAEPWQLPPQHFLALFKAMDVSAVVRLNEADTYDAEAVRSGGLKHFDLYFDDCTAPTEQVVADFHEICSGERGMVAVHCMAGLGRTGTLIATWIMKEYGWSAREAIAWLRIVRPGSVIGPQQHFLEFYEQQLRRSSLASGSKGVAFSGCSAGHSELLASQISRARRRSD